MSLSIRVITVLLAGIGASGPDRLAATAGTLQIGEPQPQIMLWVGDGRSFRRGDRVGVYFQSDVDAYVTVFRVDTDRQIRILFPWHPWNDNFVAGGREYEVFDGSGDSGPYAFTVDESPGEGYLFAIASLAPFDYRDYISDEQWDYDLIGYRGRLMGDAEPALSELTDRIIPLGSSSFGVDLESYTVAAKYAAYPLWDPYLDWCATMRPEIYEVLPVLTAFGPLGTPTVYTGPLNHAARAAVARAVSGQHSGTGVARRGTSPTAQRTAGSRSGRRVGSAGQSLRKNPGGHRTPSVRRASPDRRTVAARPAARSPRARSQPPRRAVSQRSRSPRRQS